MHPEKLSGPLLDGGAAGVFTIVEFDVSVVAESGVSGKGGLRVWSAGIEGGGHDRTSRPAESSLPYRSKSHEAKRHQTRALAATSTTLRTRLRNGK
jgi:hypothetical protein